MADEEAEPARRAAWLSFANTVRHHGLGEELFTR
jgi:hypothetical protein